MVVLIEAWDLAQMGLWFPTYCAMKLRNGWGTCRQPEFVVCVLRSPVPKGEGPGAPGGKGKLAAGAGCAARVGAVLGVSGR